VQWLAVTTTVGETRVAEQTSAYAPGPPVRIAPTFGWSPPSGNPVVVMPSADAGAMAQAAAATATANLRIAGMVFLLGVVRCRPGGRASQHHRPPRCRGRVAVG
jgi:hypothetical protein